MLLFREDVPPKKLRKLGIAPDEQAMLFLRRNFEEGMPVAAYAPLVPWAAGMKYVGLFKSVIELRSEEEVQRFITDNNLEAIYVDGYLMQRESSHWALIESQIGKGLDIVFSSNNPNVRILRVSRSQERG
jgi:hypothetical protein